MRRRICWVTVTVSAVLFVLMSTRGYVSWFALVGVASGLAYLRPWRPRAAVPFRRVGGRRRGGRRVGGPQRGPYPRRWP